MGEVDAELQEDEVSDSSAAASSDEPPVVWYALPLWRFFSFALIGGIPYVMYWAYRAWSAYRASWGYSRWPEWRAVYERTKFRINPFTRALLLSFYCYGLFVVVKREARLAGVRAWIWPWPMFAAISLSLSTGGFGLLAGVCSQHALLAASILPTQMAINRLSDRAYDSVEREPITAAELIWLGLGVLQTWLLLRGSAG